VTPSKTILVTGTRKGIGRAIAEHYLEKDWSVIGCSRSDTDLQHKNYRHFYLDVCDEKAVTLMVQEVIEQHKYIDVLANNAGIAAMNHLTLLPAGQAQNILNINILGTFFFLREVAKKMIRQKSGRIVNFSSVAVPLSLEGEALYAASKAAVETLTKIAARELGTFGVTVNAIGPTPVRTDLTKVVPNSKIEKLLQQQAIPRWGEFRDILNVIDFFVRPESDFITGQVIYLGGVTK